MWRKSHTRHIREFHRVVERFPLVASIHPDQATAAAIWLELRRALWHEMKTRRQKILSFFFSRKDGSNMAETANDIKAQNQDAKKQRPVHEIRYGALKATIWRHESDKGPWFNVVLTRSYKDKAGQWQTADSFGLRHLLEVAKLCDIAHTWIHRELAKEKPQNGQAGDFEPSEDVPF
jgi:hypothetical protein